ncbi:hypothetical protein ABPG74_011541 [Tetrahymena malaccensis]
MINLLQDFNKFKQKNGNKAMSRQLNIQNVKEQKDNLFESNFLQEKKEEKVLQRNKYGIGINAYDEIYKQIIQCLYIYNIIKQQRKIVMIELNKKYLVKQLMNQITTFLKNQLKKQYEKKQIKQKYQ